MSLAARSVDVRLQECDVLVAPLLPGNVIPRGYTARVLHYGGSKLVAAVKAFEPLKPGGLKVTPGHNLRAGLIMHVSVPLASQAGKAGPAALETCNRNCLQEAGRRGANSLVMPLLGAGIFGFSSELAAQAAVRAMQGMGETRIPGEIIIAADNAEEIRLVRSMMEVTGPKAVGAVKSRLSWAMVALVLLNVLIFLGLILRFLFFSGR